MSFGSIIRITKTDIISFKINRKRKWKKFLLIQLGKKLYFFVIQRKGLSCLFYTLFHLEDFFPPISILSKLLIPSKDIKIFFKDKIEVQPGMIFGKVQLLEWKTFIGNHKQIFVGWGNIGIFLILLVILKWFKIMAQCCLNCWIFHSIVSVFWSMLLPYRIADNGWARTTIFKYPVGKKMKNRTQHLLSAPLPPDYNRGDCMWCVNRAQHQVMLISIDSEVTVEQLYSISNWNIFNPSNLEADSW